MMECKQFSKYMLKYLAARWKTETEKEKKKKWIQIKKSSWVNFISNESSRVQFREVEQKHISVVVIKMEFSAGIIERIFCLMKT